MIVVKTSDFYRPQEWPSGCQTREEGDFLIGPIEGGGPGVHSIDIIGQRSGKNKRINYGFVEVLCVETIYNPLYNCDHPNSNEKRYKSKITFKIHDKFNNGEKRELICKSFTTVLLNTIPFINLILSEGHGLTDLNWEWIDWQCNGFDCMSECNGQLRKFLLYENDIYSKERLYDKLDEIVVSGKKVGESIVGKDNYFYDELTIRLELSFPYRDHYIAELLFDNSYTFTENNDIECTIRCNKHYAYSSSGSFKMDEYRLNKYKYEIVRDLRINRLPNFDILEMKKRRFLL